MNLDDAQRQQVMKWIEDGLKVSEIQNKLASDLGLRMTYMEVRLLLDDLKLKPKDKEAPVAPAGALNAKAAPPSGAPAPAGPEELPEEAPPGGGGVSVTVDQVTRPGAIVSGKVLFSDGQAADWYLDQMGRLGVVAKQQGYKPSQADLMAFQAELQNELARQGY
ncbi:MAG: hypothetical protein L0Y58_05220 [Verrucomicrobia subdivision 3 bacterium]|nr:hypothetical protein [Limisphaerales bacterium]